MAAIPPANTPGAGLWEAAMQGQSAYRFQPGIPRIDGGPQNVIYAPIGAVCTDDSGNIWVKSTDHTVNTGWKKPTLA